ncbi:winged helix DNA-binding domain-containing protein [Actinomadura macrotermitis]|uniref:Winged helix DNA-binding domain-containing protein n=1 Tax=Actinomadura macrotermitis TaxID=2585200 RepID=A0A7K0C1I8_9ACTN|nr:winged helix DNA-binding domain-containing protein [Actinomadura macrotermitis]MQY06942.1 hypothetical protein [Actinomadura macrotermitis]
MDRIDRRTLNRAALDRQLLLRRAEATPLEAVRRLVALQAQENHAPYHGLWTRLAGFHQDDLAALLHDRSVVRAPALRGTQHMMAAADFAWVRPLMDRKRPQVSFGGATKDWDLAELADAARDLLRGRTLTRSQIARSLAERWPERDPLALRWTVQAVLQIVHPPPSGLWNRFGATPFALAEDWLGAPLAEGPPADLARRYLAAFGPASVKDFQTWSGLRRMDEAFAGLRAYRDENGAELFDLPDAELPDPDIPAPVRFLPEFDNLVLAYADRGRLMTDDVRKAVCIGSITKATLLVDGRVRGIWTIERDKKAGRSVLDVRLFAPLADDAEVREEGERLLAFTWPGDEHDLRLAPIG